MAGTSIQLVNAKQAADAASQGAENGPLVFANDAVRFGHVWGTSLPFTSVLLGCSSLPHDARCRLFAPSCLASSPLALPRHRPTPPSDAGHVVRATLSGPLVECSFWRFLGDLFFWAVGEYGHVPEMRLLSEVWVRGGENAGLFHLFGQCSVSPGSL